MEKEIFSYCFSIKVKQKSGSTKYHSTCLNTVTSRCGQKRALRGQQREIETFLVSNKRHLKVDRDIQFCCPLVH